MNVDAAGIPAELRGRAQWVVWRVETRDGKATKVPYSALDPRRRASTTDAATWGTFTEASAVAASGVVYGVGYVFSPDDPYVGIDLDAGLSERDRGSIMWVLDSYSETSVSGSGAHVIVRAALPPQARHRKGPLEVYSEGRYFVVTGQHVRGTPRTIEERQAELDAVLAEFLPERPAASPSLPPMPVDLDDRELLERAFAASNGAELRELWHGRWQGRYGSQSEADLALCDHLAFWTGRDPVRIDRLFRASGLYREKWERTDYRECTIQTAIAATTEVFKPDRRMCVGVCSAVNSEAGVAGFQGAAEYFGVTASGLIDAVTPTQKHQRENLNAGSALEFNSEDASGSSDGRPFAMPIRDFVALIRPQAEPLLADADGRAVIGRYSLILLRALGGHGKTTLAIDMFLHLAAGVDFPPFTVPRPVSILMIENEGPEELFAAKLKLRLDHFPHELKAPLDVFTLDWGGFSLADDPLRERLVAEIARKQSDLVFGDPLDLLGIEGVGSPEDTRRFFALMRETGLHRSVAWWLNTHPRKEETKEALNEISGAWGGKPDSVLQLRMLEDDRTQVRFPKLRWTKRGTRPPILLAFDADTEAFTFIGEESEEKRSYLREIFAFVRDHPWLTAKEIAKPVKDGGVGANETTVKKELEEHPELFESRTGDEAVVLGRKAIAVLWAVRPGAEQALAEQEKPL